MLFNSLEFAAFLPIVYACYWLVRTDRVRTQNALLLVASYVFYGWWDWRFLALVFLSSAVDYAVGLALDRAEPLRRRKALLGASLCTNLGILGVFKYFDFFAASFADLLSTVGYQARPIDLGIILPVGISFYTFQTLSYTIDIYRRKIRATRDPIAFFAFVSFFPQLVAGPIERAGHLLPQFAQRRRFDTAQAKDGLRQMLWGLGKKVVVADNLAHAVDHIFGHYAELDGCVLALGTFYFAVQIYCDFSGYSDIAIGTARLFGFDLRRNFAFPYFSRDIGEFWRRWHISLSSWFRDYVYIPLGGSAHGRGRQAFNTLFVFTVSGFWHGANWTFLFWGLLNGLYYLPLMLGGRHKRYADTVAEGRLLPAAGDVVRMGGTFALVMLAWVFFRAESMTHAWSFLGHMFTHDWLVVPRFAGLLPLCAGVFVVEWFQRTKEHGLDVAALPVAARWLAYYAGFAIIFVKGFVGHVPFIYFQF
ncbi:MAG: MBOAT family O-acyltransferase, partial [Planctomycetota bacterium]